MKNDRPKFLISADIEGITGVTDKSFTRHGEKNYDLGKKYMMNDVNAVIEGILEAHPKSIITVKDAHGDSFNLNLEELNPRVHLVQGWGTTMSMVHPIDTTFDALLMVGYHANGNNQKGAMAHTYSSIFKEVRLNHQMINEGTIAGLLSLDFKAPPIFLAGDNQATDEIVKSFPWIRSFATKTSLARNSTCSLPLSESFKGIKEGSFMAVKEFLNGQLFQGHKVELPTSFQVEVHFNSSSFGLSPYEMVKGTLSFLDFFHFNDENLSLRYQVKTVKDFFGYFNMICQLYYGLK